jgi:hypothetical protein
MNWSSISSRLQGKSGVLGVGVVIVVFGDFRRKKWRFS